MVNSCCYRVIRPEARGRVRKKREGGEGATKEREGGGQWGFH